MAAADSLAAAGARSAIAAEGRMAFVASGGRVFVMTALMNWALHLSFRIESIEVSDHRLGRDEHNYSLALRPRRE